MRLPRPRSTRHRCSPAGGACVRWCWSQGPNARPSGHPPFSLETDSQFHAAARQVYDVGRTLTEEQRTVAIFWADNAGATGTPAGHWIAVVGQLARSRRLNLAAAAEAYARVGIAVHDAFVACWHEKYRTNLQRPVTYIRNHIDPAWTPYLATPPFPTYTSGHSTQSGAAAEALTDMFGTGPFTDTLRSDHGLVPPLAPRTFASFREAAMEAAVSRLYGGIHYSFDNDDGLTAGRCIGRAIRKRVRFDR